MSVLRQKSALILRSYIMCMLVCSTSMLLCAQNSVNALPDMLNREFAVFNQASTAPHIPTAEVPGLPENIDRNAAQAMRLINEYREGAGLAALSYDSSLSEMAMAHVRYSEACSKAGKGWSGHFENATYPGYSEAGQEAASTSGLAYGEADPLIVIESLLAGVFHRLQFLRPENARIGYGFGSWPGVNNSMGLFVTRPDSRGSSVESPRFIVFPPDNAIAIPPAFLHGENPDPRPGYQDNPAADKGLTGYMASISLSFADTAAFRSVRVTMIDQKGKSVQIWVTDPTHPSVSTAPNIYGNGVNNNDAFQKNFNAIFIMPKKPLERGMTYHVTAVLNFESETNQVEWSFTTQSPQMFLINEASKQKGQTLEWALEHATNGDTIKLGLGTWNVDGTIGLKGIRLSGSGSASTHIVCKGDTPYPPFSTNGTVMLDNVSISSPKSIFYMRSGSNLLLRQCILKGGDGKAIAIMIEKGASAILDAVNTVNFSTSYIAYAGTSGSGDLPTLYQRNVVIANRQYLIYGGSNQFTISNTAKIPPN